VQQVRKEHREVQDRQEQSVQLDLVILGQQDLKARKEHKDHPVQQELLVQQDLLARKVLLAFKVQRE
jgi:hypothetical protein